MSEFERRLAELAEAAGSAVRPEPGAGIRARAGRVQTRRRAVAVAAAFAVGGATTFAVQAFPGWQGPVPGISASPAESPSPAASPSPEAVASPEASESSSPSVTATPSVPACRAADVTFDWVQLVSGSTHRGASLMVTNKGPGSCTVGGYPTVQGRLPGGGPVETARHTRSGYLLGVSGTPEKAIELGAGLSAKAYVEAMAVDPATGDSCGSYGLMVVKLSGDTVPTDVPLWTNDICSSLEVHPFVRWGYGN